MNDQTKVNGDYKEAFNLGYELAKELNLKTPMFENMDLGNNRMNAMQAGMAEYSNGIAQKKKKGMDKSLGVNSNQQPNQNNNSKKDNGKGFDMSM